MVALIIIVLLIGIYSQLTKKDDKDSTKED